MSKLLKGNINYTALKPSKSIESISEARVAIERYAFKKLDPEDVRDESSGWVDPYLSFEAENFNNIMFRDSMLLGFRQDKYSFGASQLRPYLEEAEFNFMKSNNLEYITAQQKKDLKESTIKKLKMNSYPKTTITEVVWNHSNNLVYIFTQSGTVLAKFIDIFEKTFELELEPIAIIDAVKAMDNHKNLEPLLGKLWRVE